MLQVQKLVRERPLHRLIMLLPVKKIGPYLSLALVLLRALSRLLLMSQLQMPHLALYLARLMNQHLALPKTLLLHSLTLYQRRSI